MILSNVASSTISFYFSLLFILSAFVLLFGETKSLIGQIGSGVDHNCMLFVSGELKCWGSNYYAQLGYEDTNNRGDNWDEMGYLLPQVNVGTDEVIIALSVGGYHTCVKLDTAKAKCFGSNVYGQIGQDFYNYRGAEMGDTLPYINFGSDLNLTSINAGHDHTCALFTNGLIKCFGRNDYGQLGLGNTLPRGLEPNTMGDFLPFIDLGTSETVANIFTSSVADYTCVVLQSLKVKCFGWSYLGDNLPKINKYYGDDPNEMGNALPFFPIPNLQISLAMGVTHTCIISNNNFYYCWGLNNYGQFGEHVSYSKVQPLSIPQTTSAINMLPVYLINAGGYHTCFITRKESSSPVFCYGMNTYGQLGTGSTGDGGAEAQLNDNNITHFVSGMHHNCVVFSKERVKCFGRGELGQLGYGNTFNRGDESADMSGYLPYVEIDHETKPYALTETLSFKVGMGIGMPFSLIALFCCFIVITNGDQ